MVEHPTFVGREVSRSFSGVKLTVHVESNDLGFPLGGEIVELIDGTFSRESEDAGWRIPPRKPGTMEARVDLEGLKADDSHDVDLAAGWLPGGGDIVTEQPERRPQPFSRWNPNARFEAAVFLGKSPLAFEARRGVIAPNSITSDIFFPHSLD